MNMSVQNNGATSIGGGNHDDMASKLAEMIAQLLHSKGSNSNKSENQSPANQSGSASDGMAAELAQILEQMLAGSKTGHHHHHGAHGVAVPASGGFVQGGNGQVLAGIKG